EIHIILDGHPLAVVTIGSMIREDEILIPQLLDHLRHQLDSGAEAGFDAALRVCIDSLPAEYVRIIEAFAGFSPGGVHSDALQYIVKFKNELSLQRGLSMLRRRKLITADHRLDNHFVLANLIYRRVNRIDPHQPGKREGEHARSWILSYFKEYAYDPVAIFRGESQLRHAYRIIDQYKLHDFSAKLNRVLSDYLRTYIPSLLPYDAPPPRLMGERAQAIQLARHGLEIAESGETGQGMELLSSALKELQTHGSDHDYAEAMVMQARIQDMQGESGRAINTLEHTARILFDLNALDSLSIVRLGLAIAYRHHGRLKDALGVLDDRSQADAERARIYRVMGDTEGMLRALMNTSSDMTPYARAESYLQAGRYAEALAAIADDHSPGSTYLRGLIYHLQSDYEHALMGYQQALEGYARTVPERAEPARAIATIYALQERFDAAEAILIDTLEALATVEALDYMQSGRTQALLAAIHLRCGNNRTAAETATQALQKLEQMPLHADIADTYRTLGRSCWRLERYA
ncbi:MAG TPA: hypothetical protein VJZ27_02750, partial [Aggregatilineales bacterium]|nr:hypothetical protein [Aggregatilineales bacterium]